MLPRFRLIAAIDLVADYARVHGHARVPQSYLTPDGQPLGQHVKRLRRMYVQGELHALHVERLESIPGWAWSLRRRRTWEDVCAEMAREAAEHGSCAHVNGQFRTADDWPLGSWMTRQRENYHRGLLSEERQRALEAIPGWRWRALRPVAAETFKVGVVKLREFVEARGHARPVNAYKTPDGFCLGSWVAQQRLRNRMTEPKYGMLPMTDDERAQLEAIPGWEWHPPRGPRSHPDYRKGRSTADDRRATPCRRAHTHERAEQNRVSVSSHRGTAGIGE